MLFSSTACWALPQCRGTNTAAWHNCFGTGTYSQGKDSDGSYTGEWLNGVRHGWGIYSWDRGGRYEGPWRNNQQNGYGMSIMYNGDKVIGEHINGKSNGQGTYYYNTYPYKGAVYNGRFKDDLKHGEGVAIYPNGRRQEGIWENDNFKYAKTIAHENKIQHYRLTKPSSRENNSYSNRGYESYPGWDNTQGTMQYGGWDDNDRRTPERDGYSGPNYDYDPSETIAEREEQERLAKKEEKQIAAEKKQIAAEKKQEEDNKILPMASGTGFAVSSMGHIVTNNHVTQGCKDVFVHYQGEKISTTIISNDPRNDLSLIKANFKPTKVFPLSKESPYLMQKIYVAGYPFGWAYSKSLKVTGGQISSLAGMYNNFSSLQIDAALQKGNSGGPIYDSKGNVVGVATEKISYIDALERFKDIPENQNYGIKSSVVIDFLESNRIKLKTPNTQDLPTKILGENVSEATYFLSCWMTVAQIKEILKDEKTQKVMFENIIEEFK